MTRGDGNDNTGRGHKSVHGAAVSEDFNEGCKIMYDFICNELDAALPNLENNGANRVNPAMNRMLKMRMLLNAEVFIGEKHYEECAALAQELLNGTYGTYSIVSDYREIFQIGNENCPEVVFAFLFSLFCFVLFFCFF